MGGRSTSPGCYGARQSGWYGGAGCAQAVDRPRRSERTERDRSGPVGERATPTPGQDPVGRAPLSERSDLTGAEAPYREQEHRGNPRHRPRYVWSGRRLRGEERVRCDGGAELRLSGDDERRLEAPDGAAPKPISWEDELRRCPDMRDGRVVERGPDAADDAAQPRDAEEDRGDDAAHHAGKTCRERERESEDHEPLAEDEAQELHRVGRLITAHGLHRDQLD